jgi:hypothetical protein
MEPINFQRINFLNLLKMNTINLNGDIFPLEYAYLARYLIEHSGLEDLNVSLEMSHDPELIITYFISGYLRVTIAKIIQRFDNTYVWQIDYVNHEYSFTNNNRIKEVKWSQYLPYQNTNIYHVAASVIVRPAFFTDRVIDLKNYLEKNGNKFGIKIINEYNVCLKRTRFRKEIAYLSTDPSSIIGDNINIWILTKINKDPEKVIKIKINDDLLAFERILKKLNEWNN